MLCGWSMALTVLMMSLVKMTTKSHCCLHPDRSPGKMATNFMVCFHCYELSSMRKWARPNRAHIVGSMLFIVCLRVDCQAQIYTNKLKKQEGIPWSQPKAGVSASHHRQILTASQTMPPGYRFEVSWAPIGCCWAWGVSGGSMKEMERTRRCAQCL